MSGYCELYLTFSLYQPSVLLKSFSALQPESHQLHKNPAAYCYRKAPCITLTSAHPNSDNKNSCLDSHTQCWTLLIYCVLLGYRQLDLSSYINSG